MPINVNPDYIFRMNGIIVNVMFDIVIQTCSDTFKDLSRLDLLLSIEISVLLLAFRCEQCLVKIFINVFLYNNGVALRGEQQ